MLAKVRLITLALVLIHSVCGSQPEIQSTHNIANPTSTEKRNSFYFKAGKYFIKNTFHAPGAVQQIGLAYSRRITERFSLAVEYAEWNAVFASKASNLNRTVFEERSYTVSSPYIPNIGQLEERTAYRMVDIGSWLDLLTIGDYGAIRVGMAVSICWGVDYHLKSYVATPHDAYITYRTIQKEYLGLVPKISYQKNLFNGRLSLAAEYAARYYPNRIKIQQDINIAMGIHF